MLFPPKGLYNNIAYFIKFKLKKKITPSKGLEPLTLRLKV